MSHWYLWEDEVGVREENENNRRMPWLSEVCVCWGGQGERGGVPLTRLGNKIRQSRLEIYVNTNSQEIVLTKAQKMHKAFPC